MATYHLFDGTPQLVADGDRDALSLGTEFYVTAPAWLMELRFLQPALGVTDAQDRTAGLFRVLPDGSSGALVLGPLSIPAPSQGEWGAVALPTPYSLELGTHYRVVVFHPKGSYAATSDYFAGADRYSGPVVVPGAFNASGGAQGSFKYGPALALTDGHYRDTAYYSDVTISDTDPTTPSVEPGADVSLEVGSPRGNSLSVRHTPVNPITVSAPSGYVFTTSEAKQ